MNHHAHLTSFCLFLTVLLAAAAVPAQTVFFDPAVTSPLAKEFTVVLAVAGPDPVMGVDLVFTYDPTVVRLDAVDAGTFFTGSGFDYQFWNDPYVPAGTVHVSAAQLGSAAPATGSLAVFRFYALDVGVSPLYFLSLTVRDGANQDMQAEHSTGDRIIIDEAIPTDDLSFGHVKALYR